LTEEKKIEFDQNFASLIKKKYSLIPEDDLENKIDGIQRFISYANERGRPIRSVVEQTARIIYRLFNFKEVSIILRSESDGLFRYEALIGFRKESEMANRKLSFAYDDIIDSAKFPHIKLGKNAEYHLSENLIIEEGTKERYNRPFILSKEREFPDEFMEGDYIDIDIPGSNRELFGWIELGNTRDGKLPPRSHIRWIELMANILGILIQQEKIKNKARLKR